MASKVCVCCWTKRSSTAGHHQCVDTKLLILVEVASSGVTSELVSVFQQGCKWDLSCRTLVSAKLIHQIHGGSKYCILFKITCSSLLSPTLFSSSISLSLKVFLRFLLSFSFSTQAPSLLHFSLFPIPAHSTHHHLWTCLFLQPFGHSSTLLAQQTRRILLLSPM